MGRPEPDSAAAPRGAAGVLSACLVAAAAAAVLVWPGARTGTPVEAEGFSGGSRRRVLVDVLGRSVEREPSIEVPRLKLQPASIADGPVHGYFSTPV